MESHARVKSRLVGYEVSILTQSRTAAWVAQPKDERQANEESPAEEARQREIATDRAIIDVAVPGDTLSRYDDDHSLASVQTTVPPTYAAVQAQALLIHKIIIIIIIQNHIRVPASAPR